MIPSQFVWTTSSSQMLHLTTQQTDLYSFSYFFRRYPLINYNTNFKLLIRHLKAFILFCISAMSLSSAICCPCMFFIPAFLIYPPWFNAISAYIWVSKSVTAFWSAADVPATLSRAPFTVADYTSKSSKIFSKFDIFCDIPDFSIWFRAFFKLGMHPLIC